MKKKKFADAGRRMLGSMLAVGAVMASLVYTVKVFAVAPEDMQQSYIVEIMAAEHGRITFDNSLDWIKKYAEGETVALALYPDEGYVVESLTITEKETGKVIFKEAVADSHTFIMPAGNLTVSAIFADDAGKVPEEKKETAEEKVSEEKVSEEKESEEKESEEKVLEEKEKTDVFTVASEKTDGCDIRICGETGRRAAGGKVEVAVVADYVPVLSVLSEKEVFVDVAAGGYDEAAAAFKFAFIMPDADVKLSVRPSGDRMPLTVGDTYEVAVSDYRYTEYDQAGYVVSTGYFELTNGQQAFCCMHEKLAPPVGMVLTEAETCTAQNQINETMRKVLYYGWHGPGDMGKSYSVTALAVSVANGHSDAYFGQGGNFIRMLDDCEAPPDEFKVTRLVNANTGYQDLVFWTMEEKPKIQYIQIRKIFSGGNLADYDPDKSPAVYGLYADEGCTRPYDTPYIAGGQTQFRIEKAGVTGEIPVEPGIYYFKEVQAPEGWLLDSNVYKADVSGGAYDSAALPLIVESVEQPASGQAKLVKRAADAENGSSHCGCPLQGAVYGIYKDKADADSDRNRISQFTTDAKGSSGTVTLDAGTYYVKELTAPQGYVLDTEVHAVKVESGKTAVLNVTERPVLGGVKIQKRDFETKLGKAQLCATLKGAEAGVYNMNAYPVIVGGQQYQHGEKIMTLVTDENGVAQTTADALPYGHYKVVETKAPAGYLLEGVCEREFDIVENGVIADLASEDRAILDKPEKGRLTVIKKDESGNLLRGVTFLLEQYSDGDGTWKKVTEKTTDGEGKAVFERLAFAKYRITETKTVPGMTLLPAPVEVALPYAVSAKEDSKGSPAYVIDGQNYYKDITFTVSNSAALKLPATGGRTVPFVPYAAAVVAAGAAFGLWRRKNL